MRPWKKEEVGWTKEMEGKEERREGKERGKGERERREGREGATTCNTAYVHTVAFVDVTYGHPSCNKTLCIQLQYTC